jgi:hypothetical protein
MATPQNQQSEIVNQLVDFASKVLKPGGVGIGSAYGLWALFIQDDVGKAIAAALIGFCVSYTGHLLKPLHQGNHRRLQGVGQSLDAAFDDNLAKLWAKATRAEDTYLLCQALDCRDYKPEGMGARDRTFIPQLQEVFVPLALDTSAMAPGFVALHQRSQSGTGEPPEFYIWDFLARAEQESAYRQLAITAWGGFGKTTLLKHLAYIFGSQQHQLYQVPFWVPIFLPLRNYRKQLASDAPPSLPELVMEHHVKALAKLNPKLNTLPNQWAQNLLSQGKALVMFDGFDEIPEAERKKLSLWLYFEMKRFDKSVFILASRPKAYQDSFIDPLRTKVWVRPFNHQQQARFVNQWYLSQERLARGGRNTPEVEREAQRNAQNLLDQIQDEARPELADLAKNPLLLNLLATYHRSNPGVELPRQRAELYEDIVTLQLRKRPDARQIELPLSPGDRQGVLQAVALTMMERTQRLIPEADLRELIASILTDKGYSVSANEFLNQIIDVSELIVRQGLEGCEFAHLSFQEFLAAAQIKTLKQEDLLYPYLQDANTEGEEKSWWRQTILLYAAQTNPTPLIQEMLRQEATDLAYTCWQETRVSIAPEVALALENLKPKIQVARYEKLEALLKAQKWREADSETYRLMITTVGKEDGQWFSQEELLNFPCEELLAIDGLWVNYSQGKFGFSVQKQIWQECGSPTSKGRDWDRFCVRVGWQDTTASRYFDYFELRANLLNSPGGEFPRSWCEWRGRGGGGWGGGGWFSSLASRLVNCSKQDKFKITNSKFKK